MNVLVIACNAFHLGFLGAYGNSWIETPNLDRLAAEGFVFDNHFPENLTTIPTRRSWWTGRYGFADPECGWTPLRSDEPILPDLLFDQGIRSALISDVPFLRDREYGFGRGFDDVVWVRGSGYDPFIPENVALSTPLEDEPGLRLPDDDDPDLDLWKKRWSQYLRNRAALGFDLDESKTGVARVLDEATSWLERRDNSPFLLWLDVFSPHGPWEPPLPYRDQYAAVEPDEFETGEEGDLIEEGTEDLNFEEVRVLIDVPAGAVGDVLDEAELLRLRRTYAGVVTMLDTQLGRFFETLRRLGRMDDTLIVFTADQGEPLGEHGFVRRYRPWLYEELIHTPLIVRMPNGQFGGGRSGALVQTVDLLPTVLSALGLPESDEAQGHDLLAVIRGDAVKVREYACLGMDGEEFAIRTPEWHFVLPAEDEERKPQLFRKPEDRWDQNDLIGENPEIAERLELALRRFMQAVESDKIALLPPLRLTHD
jgi:arylsulfatase A-like enzyme